ncbi:STAS domain-containing protein [Streptomyces sp. NBC_01264]|uniref:STAS domain-containing protein n=1 Tax=Streptomyces sp. NBC_01264 TaxID=2903804 RepID=UPI002259AB07|nr:STAS domain-containing protein [Streptomyces sp. NBC_01264]MCX4776164.1 STAS domain-containing protein [Streptomyces sp. NBC_01264]
MEQLVTVLPDVEGVRVIACAGEFDQDTLEPFSRAVDLAVADPTVRTIVVDVSQVTFADSSMLNALMCLRGTGSRLILSGPIPARLARLFELTSAGQIFTIVDSVDAARAL